MSKKRSSFLLLMLATLALISILVAACTRPGTPTARASHGNTPTTSHGGEPTVHMGPANFVQSSVDVPKGSKLMLIDDGQFTHILSNGSWINGSAKSSKEPGAPTVNNVQVNGNNVEIGPFTTAGTYHIYCTIHLNMNLTIIVK